MMWHFNACRIKKVETGKGGHVLTRRFPDQLRLRNRGQLNPQMRELNQTPDAQNVLIRVLVRLQ